MVRPASFRKNEETAGDNFFQHDLAQQGVSTIDAAQAEFDAFVEKLRAVGINVIVFEDNAADDTPDALFPNNWITFHESKRVTIYPMYAENRRRERRETVFDHVRSHGFAVDKVVDLSCFEADNLFLEGTGSMVLDRLNLIAYCALSHRADKKVLDAFCHEFDYKPVVFHANQSVDGARLPIYHTNVMMSVGDEFAVLCLDSIDDQAEREAVVQSLTATGKEVIDISEAQMHQFAGNVLKLQGHDKRYMVMSESAEKAFTAEQRAKMSQYSEILSSPLPVIETCGGGSARCMIAEIFLPKIV